MRAAGPGHHLILFLGADWWGSDARALAAVFRSLGNALVEVGYEEFFPLQWSTFPLRVLRRLGRRLFAINYNRAVLRHAGNPAIDFVLVFKGMLLAPGTLKRFRDNGVPLYCLYPDVSFLDHGPNIEGCLPLYDCLFTTKSFHLEDSSLRRKVTEIRLVSHGFDPEVHRPIELIGRVKEHYGCDVSFVGCWSPKKERLLAALIEGCPEADVRIWGPGWTRSAGKARAAWQGRAAFGDELALIYGASRINLGLLSEAGGGTEVGDRVTARTWQIPASGAFMLHEHTAELARYFEPGVEVGTFTADADLPQQVRHYLANGKERIAMAQLAYKRCRASSYTYDAAARAILDFHEHRFSKVRAARSELQSPQ